MSNLLLKKPLVTICIITIFLLIALLTVSLALQNFLLTPIILKNNFHYVFQKGSSAKTFANDLHTGASLKHPLLFRIMLRFDGNGRSLESGEYLFPVGSTISGVVKKVVTGDVIHHNFTIVNGWTFSKLCKELNKNSNITHSVMLNSSKNALKELTVNYSSLEGLFYPNTYRFKLNTSDIDVLQRSFEAMQKYLQVAWRNRALHLSYKNNYQALIVASMVEKETSLENERPKIAAVIIRRLKIRMPLQIDATVIYGLGKDYHGILTREDLKKKTPYNTYTNYGLPPTPICMPGAASIDAALHPAKINSLYYVAKGDGSHVFSPSLRQHQLAVREFLIKQKR